MPNIVLIVLCAAFLLGDAMGKLPSWTWGLCLLLIALVASR